MSPVPGKIADKSALVYHAAMRELYWKGCYDRGYWVPTESMIADSQTKYMLEEYCWRRLYNTGEWNPWFQPELTEDFVCATKETGTIRYRMNDESLTCPGTQHRLAKQAARKALKERKEQLATRQ